MLKDKDVLNDMVVAYVQGIKSSDHELCKQNTDCCTHGMTAALNVAREQLLANALADPTPEESEAAWFHQGMLHRPETMNLLKDFIANRRARLAQPRERVKVKNGSPNCWHIELDGRGMFSCKRREDAERYAAGLRLELGEQGNCPVAP